MTPDYNNLAYEKAVFEYLLKHLESKFTAGGGTVPDVLVCEDVPYHSREVPTSVIATVVLRLSTEAQRLKDELGKYALQRIDVRPIAKPELKSDQPEEGGLKAESDSSRPEEGGLKSPGPSAPRNRRAPKQGSAAGGSE